MDGNQKGELIGTGRTAEVYAWGRDRVIKLYFPWWPRENIEYEARIGRAVVDEGVPAPKVGDIVEFEGRNGLIYERIDGPSMLDVVLNDQNQMDRMAVSLAHIHLATHQATPRNLPPQRRKIEHAIQGVPASLLPDELKQKALAKMDSLPDGNRLCHGDFHPGNIIVSAAGPRVIDWENANAGSPLADVARTLLLLDIARLYLQNELASRLTLENVTLFREAYLHEYLTETGADINFIFAWQLPIAAARMDEGIEIEESFLLSRCQFAAKQK